MFRANQAVPAPCSVATPVRSLALKTVLHAKNPAVTPVDTASARKNVGSLVSHAMRNAPGNASIRDALSCVESFAIVNAVTGRVRSVFLASIPVSVCAGNDARRSAESATKTKSRRFSSEPKTTRTRSSWNWPTVVTCLRLE